MPPHSEQKELVAISCPFFPVASVRGPAPGDSPSSRRTGPVPDGCEAPSGPCHPGWADRQARRSRRNACGAGTRHRRSGDNPRPRVGSTGRVRGCLRLLVSRSYHNLPADRSRAKTRAGLLLIGLTSSRGFVAGRAPLSLLTTGKNKEAAFLRPSNESTAKTTPAPRRIFPVLDKGREAADSPAGTGGCH